MNIKLNCLPGTYVKLFRTLERPSELSAFTGTFKAEFIGLGALRWSAPLALHMTGFGNWFGKVFPPSENAAVLDGVNLFGEAGNRTENYRMTAKFSPSVIDNELAFIVSYPADTRHPWCRASDELRMIDQDNLLGITFFNYPVIKRLPFPFLLRRVKSV